MNKTTKNSIFAIFTNRKGYTLIEISLALAIIAILAGGVLLLYNNRVAPATWSNAQYDRFNGVLAALNTCKADRGNTYPAATTAASIISGTTTTAANALAPYEGSNSTDISAWTYQCVSGSTTATIAITDTSNTNLDAAAMLVNKINKAGNTALSAVATSASVVTVTITGTTCN